MKTNIKYILHLVVVLLMVSCSSAIKNESGGVEVEEGTEVEAENAEEVIEEFTADEKNDVFGNWVGSFEQDAKEKKVEYHSEAVYWELENKINISIDKIKGDSLFGHSVVAGNNRTFKGTIIKNESLEGTFLKAIVSEPGDHKYDGTFTFTIQDTVLKGTWIAFGDIDVKKRKYELKRRVFEYDSSIMLEDYNVFVNWQKETLKSEITEEYDGEVETWINEEFATTTIGIYKVNGSNALLSNVDLENLKKEDLRVIRNTIYARHGYSFKNRPLRVFFDAQTWYIPISADIRTELTEIEKENIKLLLAFEENAEEYYDSFGRY